MNDEQDELATTPPDSGRGRERGDLSLRPLPRAALSWPVRALLVLAAVVIAIGTLVWYGRPRPTPWDRLEAAANTFPNPANWSADSFIHNHGDCSPLSPSCVPTGYVLRNLHAPPGTSVTCDQLKSLVDEWQRRGFVVRGDQQASGPIPCQTHGFIDGVSVDAQPLAGGVQIGAFDVSEPSS